jgi:glycosyltransferase involved in cell wall biosynthesis
MRILCITPYYEPAYVYGGPARSVPALCRALAGLGAQVSVFTTTANGNRELDVPASRPVQRDGVEVTYFPRIVKTSFFLAPAMAHALKRRIDEFDIAYINGIFTYPTLSAENAAIRAERPFVVAPRGMLMPWAYGYKHRKKNLYMRLIERRRIERAAAFICTDELERQSLAEFGFKQPLFVVPNGLDVQRFAAMPSGAAFRGRWQLSSDAQVILMVGRLHPVKRPDLGLAAFTEIAAVQPQAHLVFVGPDEMGLKEGLCTTAKAAGCADRVHFTGLLAPAEVLEAFAGADVFLMPSESENFGMAIAEAMAAGLPVIVAEDLGMARFVTQAEAGLAVGLNRADLARALLELLTDADRLHRMGQHGRQLAFTAFDQSAVAERTLQHLAEVLPGTRQRHPG